MRRSALIGTNILLDAVMPERPEWEYAAMVLDAVAYGNLEGYVAATSLKDAYFVLGKYIDETTARDFVQAALDAFTIVDVDMATCRIAAHSDELDFEDGLIRACAERIGVDFIISRDEHAFERSPIKRLSAQEYADLFCSADEVRL